MEDEMENNEYELYRTVSIREKEELQRRLVKARCSYLEKWKKLSIFRRRDFGGAREVCVIYVNANQREQADAVLEEFLNTRQTRRKKRRGASGRRPERAETSVKEPVKEPVKEVKAETIAVEKVSPTSYDPYSVNSKSPAVPVKTYKEVRPAYLSPEEIKHEEVFAGKEEEAQQDESYVLGDEYADLEYADEPEDAGYDEGALYGTDADFEDDYGEDGYDSYSDEGDFDDEYDDFEEDVYEDVPRGGEKRVMLINEDDNDSRYFLDDGPRLRGTTRVKGGEDSNDEDFIDDFRFD